tara:strand:- start:1134 stop:1772 length:639 start_codon:yes stop_codon:yes gene_type:complete
MSIYHLQTTNRPIDSYANLADTEVNFVSGANFRLRALQERVVGQGNSDKDKFDTSLNIQPTTSWMSGINIEGAKLTRHKLAYNKETGSLRKLFSFKMNFSVQVDYTVARTTDVGSFKFNCDPFSFFYADFPPSGESLDVVTYSGLWLNSYPSLVTTTTPYNGSVRCFTATNGFTIETFPHQALPTTGLDVWYIQVECDIIDAEPFNIDRASN